MTWLSQLFGFFRAFQCWIVIAPWEAGLLVRMGKHASVLSPGPHFRIPFVDRVFVQAVRLRSISDSGQTMATKDGRVLTIAVALSYAIESIEKLYNSVSNPEATLLFQVQGLIAEIVANANSDTLTPKIIEERVADKIPATEWGLGQVRLMVTTFAYVKVYRLLNYEYRSLSNANELESQPARN
jgi:regulator of protease activity HflC (stomatin/prohibitin superfamily)